MLPLGSELSAGAVLGARSEDKVAYAPSFEFIEFAIGLVPFWSCRFGFCRFRFSALRTIQG
jgi:hypothetical protein